MRFLTVVVVIFVTSATASPADIAAIRSGPWEAPSTWNTGVVPTAADSVSVFGYAVTTSSSTACTVLDIRQNGSVTLGGPMAPLNALTVVDGAYNYGAYPLAATYVTQATEHSVTTGTGPRSIYDWQVYEQTVTFRAYPIDNLQRVFPYSCNFTSLPGAQIDRVTLFAGLTQGEPSTIFRVQNNGTGLTITERSNLGILNRDYFADQGDDSHMLIEIDGLKPGWALRWRNNFFGPPNHIGDLQKLIDARTIRFEYSNGGAYALTADADWTYVTVSPTTEPVLALPALACFLAAWRWLRGQGWLTGG